MNQPKAKTNVRHGRERILGRGITLMLQHQQYDAALRLYRAMDAQATTVNEKQKEAA